MAGKKIKKEIPPRKVVNIFPELTPEEREAGKREAVREIYNVLVNKIF